GDRENVLAADRVFDRLDRRVEPLDMADHQGHASVARRRNDGTAFLHRRRDRLLHQDVDALRDARQRQLPMQVRGGGDGDGVDAGAEQLFDGAEGRAAECPGYEIALLGIRIDHAGEPDTGKVGEYAGMVAAHDANANHTYA